MRNLPGYPTSTDLLEPLVRVSHQGADRDVDGLSLSRELPSSFHEQVRGVGGLTQATGSVAWSPRADVVDSHPTAFNRVGNWPPKARDAIDVFTGYRVASGDLLAKQLTGSISKTDGEPLEGVGSGVVDRIARLSRKVTLPPLLNNMPPLADGGPWRGVALHPTFFTDLAARAGGFYSTPPLSSGCVFSAPLMGSSWPERGTLVTGLRYTDRNNANALWRETPWGMGVADAMLSYAPSGNSALDRPMEITAMVPPAPWAQRAYVAAVWGASNVRMSFNGGAVYGMVDGQIVASLGYDAGNVFTLRTTTSGGVLTLTLRDGAGREASAAIGRPVAISGNMSAVEVVSEVADALIGGAQVSFPSAAWASVDYVRSAFITPAAHNATLPASPAILGKTARSILEEQSQAELAALWIDGDGALQWRNRNRLVSGAPALTLSSQDHLKSLPWEEDFAGVASLVEVQGRKFTVQQSKFPVLTMWEASQSGVDPGDTFEWLVHPDGDSEWVMPDTTIESLHNPGSDGFNRFNRGNGSWIFLYGDHVDQALSGWGAAFANCTLVDHRTYRVAASIVGFSSGNENFEFTLKVPAPSSDGQAFGPQRYQPGLGTPVIRGKGIVMGEDVTYTSDAGVWDAPVLTHDVGWYVQDPAACQALADLLAANTTTPRPFLRGVSIIPDARIQLGDIVTLTDTDITGVQFRCLVVGIDDTFSGSPTQWDQSCNFRVLSTTTLEGGPPWQ